MASCVSCGALIPDNIRNCPVCDAIQPIRGDDEPSASPPGAYREPITLPAPPPGAAPPPAMALGWLILLLVSFALLGAAAFLSINGWGKAKALFSIQMIVFILAICFVPTASEWITGNRNRVARTVVESALFISLFVAFNYWVFGRSGLGIWIGYAAGLTLILEIGSRLVERYVQATLNRLIRSVSYRNLLADARSVEKMFRGELVLYLPVPAGLFIGTVVGLVENWGPSATLRFCIELVLALASLVLLFFLIIAFARMSDALFREDAVSSVSLAEGPVRSGVLGNLAKIFRFFVPSPQVDQDEQEQKDISLANMISDLRKAYLYDLGP